MSDLFRQQLDLILGRTQRHGTLEVGQRGFDIAPVAGAKVHPGDPAAKQGLGVVGLDGQTFTGVIEVLVPLAEVGVGLGPVVDDGGAPGLEFEACIVEPQGALRVTPPQGRVAIS